MSRCTPRAALLLRLALVVAPVAITSSANAQNLSFLSMFRNIAYEQTGNGNTTSLNGTFLALQAAMETAGDYDSISVTYPGPGSPQALALTTTPTEFSYQTSLLPDQPTMDDQFPFGTYTYSANNSTTSATTTASYDYTADAYPQSLPYLAGTSYSDLQGYNPASPITVQFSPFTTSPSATNSYLFFTVYDQTLGTTAYNQGFLDPTTTSLTIPGGVLAMGDDFTYELIYDSRLDIPSAGADFDAQIGYDVRTDGNFQTAPGPDALVTALMGAGGLAAGVIRLRRK